MEIILSCFDDYYQGLDEHNRAYLIEHLKAPLRAELSRLEAAGKLRPDLAYKMRAKLARIYRPIEAGKSVGIITAQSVGEMQTQTNLNVFHRAGHRDAQKEHASRLQELTCTSKTETQSAPTCVVWLKEDTATSVTARAALLRALTYKTFGSYVVGRQGSTYQLDLEQLYRFHITLEEIADVLHEAFPDVCVSCSSLHQGRLTLHPQPPLQSEGELMALRIHGIEGIIQAYFVPRGLDEDGVLIETEGSHLKEILLLPFVNSFQTTSNNMWEIYDLFGIEAVRQFLVEEFQCIMPAAHFSHVALLADRMTVSGHLKSITRYTRKSEEQASVLSKITFEETIKRATEAAFKEQVDNMTGCSASIIVGKPPSIGSGMNQLLFQFSPQ